MKKSAPPLIDDDGEVRALTAADFSRAKRGRPPLPESQKKERVTIYLDREIVEHFKKGGRGWQTRINATLKEATK